MQKIKRLGALVILSGAVVGQGAFAGSTPVLVSEQNADTLGVSYQSIVEQFLSAGYEVNRGDEFLVGVHEEDSFVDLSTLEGISVTVPIERIADIGANTPRNVLL